MPSSPPGVTPFAGESILDKTIRNLIANQLEHTPNKPSASSADNQSDLLAKVLTNSRKKRLNELLGNKSLFVLVHIANNPTGIHTYPAKDLDYFVSLSQSISSRLSKIYLAQFLDSLAPKYRIVFAPYESSIVHSECTPKESNFADYRSQDELFHACELSGIGLEMRSFSSARIYQMASAMDMLGMALLSRVTVTTSENLYRFCDFMGLAAILIGFGTAGSIVEVHSNINPTRAECLPEFNYQRNISLLMKAKSEHSWQSASSISLA